MSEFRVAIVKGVLTVLCEDEVPETDIIDLLSFDESQMESLYRDHAAIQVRWEQIAINLKNTWESFSEEFEKKWWAHNKKFAKYVLSGNGEKSPTIDSIKDSVVLIYSESTSPEEQMKYGEVAYNYAVSKDKSLVKDEFLNSMYYYVSMTPPWTYEALTRTVKKLEYNYLTVQNISKRLDARSFHMKELKDLVMAKHFNIGPVTDSFSSKEQRIMNNMRGYTQGGSNG
jgi:hypothetical protein